MFKSDLIRNLMEFGFVEIDPNKFQYRKFIVDANEAIIHDGTNTLGFKDYGDLWNYFIVNY